MSTATAKNDEAPQSIRGPKPRPPAIHYPFWFGGSAASMAAVVTHPLDLGTAETQGMNVNMLTTTSQGPPPDPRSRRPQNNAQHLHLHLPHARHLRPVQRPVRRPTTPTNLQHRPLRRLRRPQDTLHTCRHTHEPQPDPLLRQSDLDVLALRLLRRHRWQPRRRAERADAV